MTGAAKQGGPLGVLHRPGLRGQLGDDEDDDDLEGGGDDHAEGPEDVRRRPRRPGWRPPGCTAEDEEHDGQDPLGVLDQLAAGSARPCGFSSTRVRALTSASGSGPSRTGPGSRSATMSTTTTSDEQDDVLVSRSAWPLGRRPTPALGADSGAAGRLRPGPRAVRTVVAARRCSARSLASMASASSSSSWSMPSRCSTPWTTSRASSSS